VTDVAISKNKTWILSASKVITNSWCGFRS